MMIRFEKSDAMDQNVLTSREAYLDSLPVAQELFVEMQVRQGIVYTIMQDQEQWGHLIIGPDNVLVEFYLTPVALSECETVFTEILKEFNIQKAFCKSFDSLLLKNCLIHHKEVTIEGTLFRDRLLPTAPNDEINLEAREIQDRDIPDLVTNREGLFDTDVEAIETAKLNCMLVFEQAGQTVGWGLFQRINEGRPYFDIGMLVHRDERKKGYGTAIISYLADYCITLEGEPICGCARGNAGSRKTLERAGFRSRYDLLAFHF